MTSATVWQRDVTGMRFRRITVDPDKMEGVSRIRGLRMPVATVVSMMADGMTTEEILREHPTLEAEAEARTLVRVTGPW